jgi:hypothetical protein
MRKILFALLGAGLAALIIACGSGGPTIGKGSDPQGPVAATGQAEKAVTGPQGFKVGEHATLTLGSGSTADLIVESVKVQGKSIVAKVTVTCKTGSVNYNMFDWTAVAGDGTKLDLGSDIDVTNELHSGTLAAGQKVTGAVQFAGGQAQLHGARIVYSGGFSGDLAYWTVP